MNTLIGVSSSSLPHSSASDLLEAAARSGAACLDLRAGRNQAWEPDLKFLVDSMPIAFLGVGAVIGDRRTDDLPQPKLLQQAVEFGIPIRFFSAPLTGATAQQTFADDVDDLRREWGASLRIVIEPHGKLPTLSELEVVASRHDVGMVVDTLGLIKLGARLDAARDFIRQHGKVAQVKGVARGSAGYRHVALDDAPRLSMWMAALLDGFKGCITVETHAGSVPRDIATLRRLLQQVPVGVIPESEDIAECVPAL